ncbi:MAG: hypothetical protein ACRELY_26015 [Polyangiaceae bacterium]
MNCSRCGRAIAGVFPGAKVTCECGAENVVQASTVDPYRTPASASSPDAALHEDAPKKKHARHACPKCGGLLARSGEGMLACAACEGTFFTEQALQEVIDRVRSEGESETVDSFHEVAPAEGAHLEDVRYLACPFCGERMNRAIFGRKSGIVVDVCPQHGTWFDHGEVTRAVSFAVTHDMTKGSAKPELSEEDIRKRAEVEALMMKESAMDATYDLQYRARVYGVGPTIVDQLALVIGWLRGG